MKIAIFTNKPYDKCETFIKVQIDMLPFKIVHYWGHNFPFNFQMQTKKRGLIFKVLSKFSFIKQESIINQFCNELLLNKVTLVFAQYGMIGQEVLEVCKHLQLPLVVHFHGHDAVRKSVLETYSNYQTLFAYSNLKIISVSHEMTKRLISIGCPEEKIIYNVYGVNNDFLNLKPNYNKTQFVSIGRFVEKKAPQLTLLAFKVVLDKHPESQLIYAGDGVLLNSCKDMVTALDMSNNVTFPGRISPKAYQLYLQDSLAYVQHSITAQDGDMEGTPVSIIEASAAGLPVVSTLHAGIPDVVIHNKTGLLSNEKDITTMAYHMSWIIDHKEEASKMGEAGKKRIQEHFPISKYINGLTTIIEFMLEKR